MSKKRNLIWTVSRSILEDLVLKSSSLNQILKGLNLDNKPSSYRSLKSRLEKDNISYTHIKLGISSNKGRKFSPSPKKIPLSSILVENSSYTNRCLLKNRLIKEFLLVEKCYECGLTNTWNNKPLVLQLDHINGISNDHRIENLRLLCPNCHSQTSTFAGRNINKDK